MRTIKLETACGCSKTLEVAGSVAQVRICIEQNVIKPTKKNPFPKPKLTERIFSFHGIEDGMEVYREMVE